MSSIGLLPVVRAGDRMAVEMDGPTLRREESGDGSQQTRLAGAIRAEQGKDLVTAYHGLIFIDDRKHEQLGSHIAVHIAPSLISPLIARLPRNECRWNERRNSSGVVLMPRSGEDTTG